MAADNPAQMTADDRFRLNQLSAQIIGAAHKVSNTLGTGFLEKVYENALCVELRRRGLHVEQQRPLKVVYEGAVVGDYVTDLLVEDRVLVELKASSRLDRTHYLQCAHYLRSTGLRICLLLNFGHPHIEIRRIVSNF